MRLASQEVWTRQSQSNFQSTNLGGWRIGKSNIFLSIGKQSQIVWQHAVRKFQIASENHAVVPLKALEWPGITFLRMWKTAFLSASAAIQF